MARPGWAPRGEDQHDPGYLSDVSNAWSCGYVKPSFRRRLLYLDELKAKRPHPVKDRVQLRLVKVSRQDGDGRLDLHRHVGKRLTGSRTERADDPDFINVPGHQGLLPKSGRDRTILAAIFRAGIIRLR